MGGLERPGKTGSAPSMRGPLGYVLTLKLNDAFRREVEPSDNVDQCGLTGPVGANKPNNLVAM